MSFIDKVAGLFTNPEGYGEIGPGKDYSVDIFDPGRPAGAIGDDTPLLLGPVVSRIGPGMEFIAGGAKLIGGTAILASSPGPWAPLTVPFGTASLISGVADITHAAGDLWNGVQTPTPISTTAQRLFGIKPETAQRIGAAADVIFSEPSAAIGTYKLLISPSYTSKFAGVLGGTTAADRLAQETTYALTGQELPSLLTQGLTRVGVPEDIAPFAAAVPSLIAPFGLAYANRAGIPGFGGEKSDTGGLLSKGINWLRGTADENSQISGNPFGTPPNRPLKSDIELDDAGQLKIDHIRELTNKPFQLPGLPREPRPLPLSVEGGYFPSAAGLKNNDPDTFQLSPETELRRYSILPPGQDNSNLSITNINAAAAGFSGIDRPSGHPIGARRLLDDSYQITITPPNAPEPHPSNLMVWPGYRGSERPTIKLPEIFEQPGQGLDPAIMAQQMDAISLRAGAGVKVNWQGEGAPWAPRIFGVAKNPEGRPFASLPEDGSPGLQFYPHIPPRVAFLNNVYTGDILPRSPALGELGSLGARGPLPGVLGEITELSLDVAKRANQDWLVGSTRDPNVFRVFQRFETNSPFKPLDAYILPDGVPHLYNPEVIDAISPLARNQITTALNAVDPRNALHRLPLETKMQLPPDLVEYTFGWDLRSPPTLAQRFDQTREKLTDVSRWKSPDAGQAFAPTDVWRSPEQIVTGPPPETLKLFNPTFNESTWWQKNQ